MNHASAAEIARSTRWLAVCLLLITFSTLSPTLGRAADWPMPDYDAGRTRHNVAEPGLLLPLPALWQSSPGQFTLFGEPIMAAGRVYSICSAPGAETRHSGVCAFDLPTGGLVWQRMIPDLFGELPPTPQAWLGWSQLSWADGRLFVVLNDLRGVGGTNRVAGLGGADGATLWLHPIAMDDDFSSAAQVMTRAPFVDDDTVILLGGLKGRTFGLATDTGMQRWAIETDEFRGCGS
ncbi:MAG: PQQ-binding-like beta-propeller repeat protein, partial [Acidobacteriota bacterium]